MCRKVSLILAALAINASFRTYAQPEVKQLGADALGYVHDICISANEKLFLSTSGGIYTSDGTHKWNKVDAPFNSIYYHGKFLQLDSAIYTWDFFNGIHYTLDNGASWIDKYFFIPSLGNSQINDLDIEADTFFIAGPNGLAFLAPNTLVAVLFDDLAGEDVLALEVSESLLVAGVKGSKLYISSDAGKSWSIRTNLPFDFSSVPSNQMILIGTKIIVGSYGAGVWQSDDLGSTWSQQNDGLGTSLHIQDIHVANGKIYLSNGSFYSSEADDINWQKIGGGLNGRVIAAKGEEVVLESRGDILKSTDSAASFSAVGISGIFDSSIYQFFTDPEGTLYATSPPRGTFRRRAGEPRFSYLNDGYGKAIFEDDRMYSLINGGSIVIAYDRANGERIDYFRYTTDFFFPQQLIKVQDEYYVSTLQQGVWKYTHEKEWVDVSEGLPSLKTFDFKIDKDTLYLGTESGLFYSALSDFGWKRLDFGADNQRVDKFIVVDSVIIISGFYAGTYVSHDKGGTWSKADDVAQQLGDIVFFDSTFYACSYKSLYFSNDSGKSWQSIDMDLHSYPLSMESIWVSSDSIYIGTIENGILGMKKGLPQTVDFSSIPTKTYGDSTFALMATSSSGLPVTFSSSDETVVTISGNMAEITGAGTVIISASQGGGNQYFSVSVSQELVVHKAEQTISFGELPQLTTKDAGIPLAAEASSSLPVSFASADDAVAIIEEGVLKVVGAGETTITASQAGNENYLAAESVTREFVVKEVTGLGTAPNSEVVVFPNPMSTTITIDLGSGMSGKANASLFNLAGTELLKESFTSRQHTFQLSLPAGVYFLAIFNAKGQLVKQLKVVKE